MKFSGKRPAEFDLIHEAVLKECGFAVTGFEWEPEGSDYAAAEFMLGNRLVKFRCAKVTPVKNGQFVTLWKRNENGITQPFDVSDKPDLYLVVTSYSGRTGFFLFPKSVLAAHKIIGGKTAEGKRGIRVYPNWDMPASGQALQTQRWQTKYFFEIHRELPFDREKIKLIIRLISDCR